jgi:GNAT superfamily N-acetyltransferase
MDYRLIVAAEPGPEDRRAVLDPLSHFNESMGFPSDTRPVAILLAGNDGEPAGGLWGKTGYGWLFVEFLSVPEQARGRGLGAALMNRAEAIALESGCVGSWLTTFSFQAQGFYEKLGYSVFGRLEDSPAGNDRIFMRKRFQSPG